MSILQLLGRPYGDQTHYWLGVAQLTSLALSFITHFSSGQPIVTLPSGFPFEYTHESPKTFVTLCIQEEKFYVHIGGVYNMYFLRCC
jgi:hypothetical protein